MHASALRNDLSEDQMTWLIAQLPQSVRNELFSALHSLRNRASNERHNETPLIGWQSNDLLRRDTGFDVHIVGVGNHKPY